MRRHLGCAIILSLLFLAPVSGTEINLSTDPLWRVLMLAPSGGAVPLLASSRGGESGIEASCTASCGSTVVTCSGSGSCTAVDRDCSVGQRGYVTCGTSTIVCPTGCPPPPPSCDNYDTGWCDYSWDAARGCCVASEFCPNDCSN